VLCAVLVGNMPLPLLIYSNPYK